MTDTLQNLLSTDLSGLVQAAGLIGIAAIVFVETGLLVGFFLPGDSLLITAGVFAARGELDLGALVLWTSLAAILGDATGYSIGRRAGRLLGGRGRSPGVRRNLEYARRFYARHGGAAIVIARFVPLLRTFAPVVAGTAAMPYRRFFAWNAAGAVVWVGSMSLTGYFLGRVFVEVEGALQWLLTSLLVVALSTAGARWWQRRRGPAAGRRTGRTAWSRRVSHWSQTSRGRGRLSAAPALFATRPPRT